jgi:hypothetical protein
VGEVQLTRDLAPFRLDSFRGCRLQFVGPFGGRGCREGLPTPIPSGDGAGAARDREDDGVDRHANRVVQLATDQIDCRQQAQRQPALPVPRAASGHASAAVAAVNENPSSTGSPVTGPIDVNVAAVPRPAAQPRRTET